MAVSLQELAEMARNAGCATFRPTNLHLHTPATPWDWDAYAGQTHTSTSLMPEEYFGLLAHTSLELVAITDHNCIDWCRPLIDLARDARAHNGSRLHILPGVEITTYEGPHLAALFSEDTDPEAIRDMLRRLGMSGQGREDDRVSGRTRRSPKTIFDVLTEIEDLGGIAVGPHVGTSDGLWGARNFRSRSDVLNDSRIRILSAPSGDIKRVCDHSGKVRLLYKNMPSDSVTNSFAFLNASDCHRVEDFEVDTTWLKMCYPSLEGVRQIMFEPELRVGHQLVDSGAEVEHPIMMQFTAQEGVAHPHLIGVAVTGGTEEALLDGQRIGFSPHLNCIIGKNYAGKSAVLDCLRFALDLCSSEELHSSDYIGRLRAFIGEGGQVRVYLQGHDGRTYAVARLLSCTRVGSSRSTRQEVEGLPDVYVLLDDEFHRDSQVSVEDVIGLETYPQGQVVMIKNSASQQMSIVDDLARVQDAIKRLVDDEVDGEKTARGRLVENGEEIVGLETEKIELQDAVEGIGELETEIRTLEELSNSPALVEIKQWADAESYLEQCMNGVSRHQRALREVEWPAADADAEDAERSADDAEAPAEQPFDPASATPAAFVREAKRQLEGALYPAKESFDDSTAYLSQAMSSLRELANRIAERFTAARAAVSEDGSSQNTDLQAELVERIAAKRRRLAALKESERHLVQVEEQLRELWQQRCELKRLYQVDWGRVREERRQVVDLINRHAADNIRADLVEGGDDSEYRELLNRVADRLTSATNRIANKHAQIDLIASALSPEQLAALVGVADANRLMADTGVSANTARVLLSMSTADLHELDLCVLHDRFVISFRREGDETYTPIDGGLSGGEQALALISVAMIPKTMPLLIDQPEDELGPALITNDLVEQIRRVKPDRQLVFVTHVANIPVLADSEQIVYVEQRVNGNSRSSRAKHCGSLDNRHIVSDLLELDGGQAAFQRRYERYAAVMEPPS